MQIGQSARKQNGDLDSLSHIHTPLRRKKPIIIKYAQRVRLNLTDGHSRDQRLVGTGGCICRLRRRRWTISSWPRSISSRLLDVKWLEPLQRPICIRTCIQTSGRTFCSDDDGDDDMVIRVRDLLESQQRDSAEKRVDIICLLIVLVMRWYRMP